MCSSRNGSGVNPEDFACLSLPRVNAAWVTSYNHGVATLGTVLAIASSPSPPLPFGAGEVLVPIVPEPLLFLGSGDIPLFLPDANFLIGLPFSCQGFRIEDAGGPVLVPLNAIDIVVGP